MASNSCSMFLPISKRDGLGVHSLLTAVYILISILILTVNIMMIVGLIKIERKMTRINVLFIFLSLCDLSVGVVMLPFQVYLLHVEHHETCDEVAAKSFVNCFTAVMSGLTTCLITNDRYLYIAKKDFYVKNVTPLVLAFSIVFEFIIALAWSASFFHYTTHPSFFPKGVLLFSFSIFEGFILFECVLINVFLYCFVSKKTVEIRRMSATVETRPVGHSKKFARTLSIICGVLLVAYLPSMMAMLCKSIVDWMSVDQQGISLENQHSLSRIIPWLLIPTNLNSAANSLVFMWRNKTLLRYYKTVCRGEKFKPIGEIFLRSRTTSDSSTMEFQVRPRAGTDTSIVQYRSRSNTATSDVDRNSVRYSRVSSTERNSVVFAPTAKNSTSDRHSVASSRNSYTERTISAEKEARNSSERNSVVERNQRNFHNERIYQWNSMDSTQSSYAESSFEASSPPRGTTLNVLTEHDDYSFLERTSSLRNSYEKDSLMKD